MPRPELLLRLPRALPALRLLPLLVTAMRSVVLLAVLLLSGCIAVNVPEPSSIDSQGTSPGAVPAEEMSGAEGPDPPKQPERSTEPPQENATPEAPSTNATATPATLQGWANPALATIYPGVRLLGFGLFALPDSAIATCSTNFIFTNPNRTAVYIGTASHCVMDYDQDAEVECQTAVPSYDNLILEGAAFPVRVAYSSWQTIGDVGMADALSCSNDFALLEIDPRDWGNVSPRAHGHGGPLGIATRAELLASPDVYIYGHGLHTTGTHLGTERYGWVKGCVPHCIDQGGAFVWTEVNGGIIFNGDSGGFSITENGNAAGITAVNRGGISYLASTFVADLEFLHGHTALRVELATWDEFVPIPDQVRRPTV